MSAAGKPLTCAAFGARGTGKTSGLIQYVASNPVPRQLIWDFKHDPSLREIGTPYQSLPALIRAMQAPRFNVRYLVNHGLPIEDQFDLVCRAAWEAGDLRLWVCELPEVTRASKAPAAWRRVVNVGRDYVAGGKRKWISILADAQRPAECDKSFVSNCDIVRSGRLGHLADARYLAALLRCAPEDLMNLPDLHYIEKRADNPEPVRGVLSFGHKKPAAAKKTAPARRRA